MNTDMLEVSEWVKRRLDMFGSLPGVVPPPRPVRALEPPLSRKGIGRGKERIMGGATFALDTVARSHEQFTAEDVARAMHASLRSRQRAAGAICRWVAKGYVRVVREGKRSTGLHTYAATGVKIPKR